MTLERVRTAITTHAPELIALRRLLHAHPELSGCEHQTTEILAERLAAEGLTPTLLSTGTGLVCDIAMDADSQEVRGPIVALRADIDALAMDDRTTTAHRSQLAGVAHACGHDAHAAVVLGAALALLDARRAAPRPGIVRIIFEPSEEIVPGGAVDVIADGWLEGVLAIYGVHCDPKVDCGYVGLKAGPLTSAADKFEITLTGPGGHTARPEETVDLVRWTGRIADQLADRIREHVPADVTVVLGSVHAGAAANVIPATATLGGSLRTPHRSAWLVGEQALRATLDDLIAGAEPVHRPEWTLAYTRGVPPVINDPDTTETVRQVALTLLGPDGVVDTEQSMGGDSFAWYAELVPGTYVRLGTHDPGTGASRGDLHSATFDIDEGAIAVGASLLAGTALAALAAADGPSVD